MQSRHQRIPPKAAHGQRAGMGILGRGNSRSKAKGHERFVGGWGGQVEQAVYSSWNVRCEAGARAQGPSGL